MHSTWFRSPAIIAAPIGALLAIVYLQDATDPYGYSAAAIAQGGIALTVIAPFCALFGVLEGARYKAAANLISTSNRRLATIIVRLVLPVTAAGILLLAFSQFVVASTVVIPQTVTEGLVVVSQVIVVVAFTLFGFALGSNLPKAFAIPASVVVPWMWLVYPSATEPLWMRHLNGNLSGCCDISVAPATDVAIAGALVAIAIAIVSLMAVPRIRGKARSGLAALAGLLLVAIAVNMAQGLGHSPGTARDTGQLVCIERVCVWPENRKQLSSVIRQQAKIRRELDGFGMSPPELVTEDSSAGRRAWIFGTTPDAGKGDIGVALVAGLLPATPKCAETRPYDTNDTRPLIERWIFESAGVDANGLEIELGAQHRRKLGELRAMPKLEQGTIVDNALSALNRCS